MGKLLKLAFSVKVSIIPLQSIQVVQERYWDDNIQCLGVLRGRRRRERGGLGEGHPLLKTSQQLSIGLRISERNRRSSEEFQVLYAPGMGNLKMHQHTLGYT